MSFISLKKQKGLILEVLNPPIFVTVRCSGNWSNHCSMTPRMTFNDTGNTTPIEKGTIVCDDPNLSVIFNEYFGNVVCNRKI